MNDHDDSLFHELREEFLDFIEDFIPRDTSFAKPRRTIKIYGLMTAVRPAYAFAERIENILKLVFGISIIISAFIASVWGFTSLSSLLDSLLTSLLGRVSVFLIGCSYCIVGLWKILHIGRIEKGKQ